MKDLVYEFIILNPGYKNDVKNFIDYLGEDNFYNKLIIGGMTTNEIIKSLQSLNKKEVIKTKNTASKYMHAIGRLFFYILKNSDIKNTDLFNEIDSKHENSYSKICHDYINSCETLSGNKIYPALNATQVDKLVKWCDEEISKMLESKGEINYRIGFKRMTVALCVKVMLLTGITYRVARFLKFSALDEVRNCITIEGFTFRMPLKLSEQFIKYKRFCYNKGLDVEHGYLFVNEKGEQWGKITSASSGPQFFETVIGQNDFTGIIKYGITQLLLAGVDSKIIMQITDAKEAIINDCIDCLTENEKYTYINSKICVTEIYKYL